jgi:hypothetical protein
MTIRSGDGRRQPLDPYRRPGAPAQAERLGITTMTPNAAQRDPHRLRPVFVLAPARSHSSVVVMMLGRHPALYGFPELSLFRVETVAQLLAPDRMGEPPRIAGALRSLAQVHDGKQDDESIERARHWLDARQDWDVASAYDHLLDVVAPAIGVQKAPEDSNREDYLARLHDRYPEARFVHLTRHPITAAASMHRAWATSGLWEVPPELFHMYCLGTWLFHHSRIQRFTRQLGVEQWRRVRSEDVLNQPRTVLPDLCRWLEISADDDALEAMLQPQLSPYARFGPTQARGGNDPAFLADPNPRQVVLPDTVTAPADWIVDPWLFVSLVRFADELGYRSPRSPQVTETTDPASS